LHVWRAGDATPLTARSLAFAGSMPMRAQPGASLFDGLTIPRPLAGDDPPAGFDHRKLKSIDRIPLRSAAIDFNARSPRAVRLHGRGAAREPSTS